MEFAKQFNINMKYFVIYELLATVIAIAYRGDYPQPADSNLLHYEPVYYDPQQLQTQHLNAQQSPRDHPVILAFHAFERNFSLHLLPDTSSLTSDIILVHKNRSTKPDLSFIYSGTDQGHPESVVTGAIINGTFQGTVKLSRDVIYHVLSSSSVFTNVSTFPSVIYLETDYNKTKHLFDSYRDGVGKEFDQTQKINVFKTSRRHRDTRDSRAILHKTNEMLENKVCTLKLTTDHTVWRHIMKQNNQNEQRSLHEISYMLTDHFRELKTIFRETKFPIHKGKDIEMDIQGIEFEIKKIVVMTEEDCADKMNNPICMENITGEQLLRNFADAEYVNNNNGDFDYENAYGDSGAYNSYSDNYGDYVNNEPDDPISDTRTEGFEQNLSQVDYCLSFLFTARVLYGNNGNPLLGLTYTPKEGEDGAGVCNTGNNGFVSFFLSTDKYFLPPVMTQLVFTHEVAHAFGALHDDGEECRMYNLQQEPEDGFYLMHSIAQNGNKINNRRFSPCSLDKMGAILSQGKHVLCLKQSALAVCGNGIVETGEECDCGTHCHHDNCCYGRGHNKSQSELDCTLKPKAQCSPSQGPCCDPDTCSFISQTDKVTCHNAEPCVDRLYCDGSSYGSSCPPPTPSQVRPDNTVCNYRGRLRVCNAGSCNTSICTLIGWSECQMTNDNGTLTIQEKEELCYVGCRESMHSTCISTNDDTKIESYQDMQDLLNNVSAQVGSGKRAIQFPIGTPCNRMTGYCDVFMRCRGVDPDTSLDRLRKCLETEECLMELHHLAVHYWWVIFLGTIATIMIFCVCVKCCVVHTNGNNSNLEHKQQRRNVCQSVNSKRQFVNHVRKSVRNSLSTFRTFIQRRSQPNNNEIQKSDAKHKQELHKLTIHRIDIIEEKDM